MVKAAGFLKKLKNLKNIVGKGAGWINENLVKPLRPVIDTGLEMAGLGGVKQIVDAGSRFIDKYSGYKPSGNNQFRNMVTDVQDFALETQRTPAERKYSNPFGNYLN